MAALPPIREWRNVDHATFRNEIMPANAPAVLRGLVADWPAVQAGRASANALATYIKRYDNNRPVAAVVAPPDVGGRFFYRDDLGGLNFDRLTASISQAIDKLIELQGEKSAPSVAIQSAVIPEHLPGFSEENPMPLVDREAVPRIWIGNAVTVRTHFDFNYNIACVVGGRRRFTLFPPDQIGNLYVGPIDFTPAGAPVSMVAPGDADPEKYPRFAEAMKTAVMAELEPGDALYIPYFWWHHVESLTPFNVLVNYWWREVEAAPLDVLLHALLVMRDLPQTERDTWRSVFDHYVFQTGGDPAAHIAQGRRGVLAPLDGDALNSLKTHLVDTIKRL